MTESAAIIIDYHVKATWITIWNGVVKYKIWWIPYSHSHTKRVTKSNLLLCYNLLKIRNGFGCTFFWCICIFIKGTALYFMRRHVEN